MNLVPYFENQALLELKARKANQTKLIWFGFEVAHSYSFNFVYLTRINGCSQQCKVILNDIQTDNWVLLI